MEEFNNKSRFSTVGNLKTLSTPCVLSDFIDYWDKVIANWFVGKSDPEQVEYGKLMNADYMPEPYLGNPCKCSFVIVNYNAGGGNNQEYHIYKPCCGCTIHGDLLSRLVRNSSYSEIELPFPYLETFPALKAKGHESIKDYSGYGWWQNKKLWIDNVCKAAGVKSIDDGVMPFAIELCAWHSKSWSDTSMIISNPALKKVVEDRVINVIKTAIDHSEAKFAYFIGKMHIPLLLAYDFEQIGGSPITATAPKGKNRFFATFEHRVTGHKAIVTWTIGSNKHPGKNFFGIEDAMIKTII